MFDSKESTHLTVTDFYSAVKIMMHGVKTKQKWPELLENRYLVCYEKDPILLLFYVILGHQERA